MPTIHAKTALLPSGWVDNVILTIAEGRIETIAPGTDGDTSVDILLPALANLHSHAFQRAMAGLTEKRGPDASDSFWTWRSLMYRFLDHLTPDDIQSIAAYVQLEMLQSGYAAVGEFHYLHHQPGGAPYDNLAELSDRIIAAAADTGIGLTHLPVLYMQGGCDGRPLGPGQDRFGNSADRFAKLHEQCAKSLAHLPNDAMLGMAPHSLRAVNKSALAHALPDHGPIHMHLAEQRAEVDEVLHTYGARPTEWALDNLDVNERWCMIHATQMKPHETKGLAATGAVAGLCPITESSLGDGIFDGVRWLDHQGRIGIGSDSNIRIACAEELRTLDYSQRLRDHTRAALATADKSTGRRLYDACASGGAQALGRDAGTIEPGKWADLVALDGDATDLIGKSGDTLLDAWIFASDDRLVRHVWSAGRPVITEGRHPNHAKITDQYRATLHRLGAIL